MSQRTALINQIIGLNSQLTSLNSRLLRVQEGIPVIQGIVTNANNLHLLIGQLECDNPQYWRGSEQAKAQTYYEDSKDESGDYVTNLEQLESELVAEEARILDGISSLEGRIRSLNNQLDNLVN